MEQMQDYIVRGIAAQGQIRCFAITCRHLVEEARTRHNTSPVVTTALGRLLAGGAMMGTMMKDKQDLLTLQIQCSGPIGGLTVTADAFGHLKGYAKHPIAGELTVGKAIDLGVLTVIKDIGMKEPYTGQVQLVSGEIAEDLTYYFATSEQTPSSVALGVLMNKNNTVAQAGGYILQLMPGTTEDVISTLEQRLADIEPVTALLSKGHTPESMLSEILKDFTVVFSEQKIPASFSCNCSKERVSRVLVSLGAKELEQLINDNEPIELNCHFCNTNYHFDTEELIKIKNSLKT